MTEPQVWTMIGVFATLMFGMLTIVSTLFVRVVRTEIGSLRTEMRGGIGSLRTEMLGEIGSLRAEVGGEIGRLHQRIDALDRDVQALVKHTFGIDRG